MVAQIDLAPQTWWRHGKRLGKLLLASTVLAQSWTSAAPVPAAAGEPSAAEREARYSRRTFVYTIDAAPFAPQFITDARKLVAGDSTFEPTRDFLIAIHRVGPGSGVVLMARTSYDDVGVVDEESITKITLFLPAAKLPQGVGGEVAIGGGDMGASGVYTQASVAWGVGCVGIATSGIVRLSTESPDLLLIEADVVFSVVDSETWKPSEYCSDVRYNETATYRYKTLSSLTPWEGAGKGVVSKSEWWP